MQRPADLEGTFTLAPDAFGPIRSGFRPAHQVHENYLTSGEHEYLGVEEVHPGQIAHARVWLISPEVYPRCLWPGRVIHVTVGARTIGTLKVAQVLNPILLCSPEAYLPNWSVPQGLS
jgi:hypothetical protein